MAQEFRVAALRLLPMRCAICGFSRYVERAHIVPRRLAKGAEDRSNTLWLCPTHHRVYDCGLLIAEERVFLEAWLLRAVEVFFDRIDAQQYLYFQLGLLSDAPPWIVWARRKWLPRVQAVIPRGGESVDNDVDNFGEGVTPLKLWGAPPYPRPLHRSYPPRFSAPTTEFFPKRLRSKRAKKKEKR